MTSSAEYHHEDPDKSDEVVINTTKEDAIMCANSNRRNRERLSSLEQTDGKFIELMTRRKGGDMTKLIDKQKQRPLFQCYQALKSMVLSGEHESHILHCIGFLRGLITKYGVPVILMLNTRGGIGMLCRGSKTSEKLVRQTLKLCISTIKRELPNNTEVINHLEALSQLYEKGQEINIKSFVYNGYEEKFAAVYFNIEKCLRACKSRYSMLYAELQDVYRIQDMYGSTDYPEKMQDVITKKMAELTKELSNIKTQLDLELSDSNISTASSDHHSESELTNDKNTEESVIKTLEVYKIKETICVYLREADKMETLSLEKEDERNIQVRFIDTILESSKPRPVQDLFYEALPKDGNQYLDMNECINKLLETTYRKTMLVQTIPI